MSFERFSTVTPCRCTSVGSRGLAIWTRLFTSVCALSPSEPTSNVTVIVTWPFAEFDDEL